MAGSYDTFDTNAAVSGTRDKISYAVSGRYAVTDGYRDNSGSESKDVGANLNYYAADWMELAFSTDYHKDSTELPGGLKESDFERGASRTDTVNPDNFADVEDYFFKAGPRFFFLNDSRFTADASYRERSSTFDITFSGGTFTGDTDIETITVSPQFIIKEKVSGFENSLTIGFDFEKAEEDIENISVFFGDKTIGTFELEKENMGYYIYDEFKPNEDLAVSAGYRFDRAEFTFDPGTPDHVTQDENAYNFGASYTFYGDSYIYAGYSRSFRYPVLDEFFNFTTNTVNTELVPQTSDDFELGIRHYFTDSFYTQINFFRIDTEDEIFYNPFTFSNENLDGETRRQGVEFTISKNFRKLSLSGSYSYTDAEIRDGDFEGNEIPNVPEHKASFKSVYALGNFLMTLTGIYVGERPFDADFNNEFNEVDDFFVLNAKLQYKWKQFTPFIDLKNITNEQYSEYGVLGGFPLEPAFYPSPRFNFLAGLTCQF